VGLQRASLEDIRGAALEKLDQLVAYSEKIKTE
jgi:hypothetical protein